MRNSKVLYVGLDVHAEKTAVSVMERTGRDVIGERMLPNVNGALDRYMLELRKTGAEIQACYEAGFCGFELARRLRGLGIECTVAAPGMLPKMPSDRVKTDRRDARTLARALRNGDVHEVVVPPERDEVIRDYLRMNEDRKKMLKQVKQQLLHFLHRRGLRYTEGGNWTASHRRWLTALAFSDPIEKETLDEYYIQITELEEQCARFTVRIEEMAKEERYAEPVRRLKAFKGIETLIALSLIVEIGDFRRFATAERFMAFLGLVPSERSSGGKRRQGGITKSGNTHLRKLLVEAGWHYRSYLPVSRRLAKRREGLPAELVAYAHRAGRRLNRKFVRLLYAGKLSQVAAIAVARELSGFVWGAMTGNVT